MKFPVYVARKKVVFNGFVSCGCQKHPFLFCCGSLLLIFFFFVYCTVSLNTASQVESVSCFLICKLFSWILLGEEMVHTFRNEYKFI